MSRTGINVCQNKVRCLLESGPWLSGRAEPIRTPIESYGTFYHATCEAEQLTKAVDAVAATAAADPTIVSS
jgi:hypothetical protein